MTAHRREADREAVDSAARIWQVYADQIGIPDARALAADEPLARDHDASGHRTLHRVSRSVGRALGVALLAAIVVVAGTALWRNLFSAPATLPPRAVSVPTRVPPRSADHPTRVTAGGEQVQAPLMIAAPEPTVPTRVEPRAAEITAPATTTAVAPSAVSAADSPLYRVTFDFGSDRVRDDSRAILHKVVAAMKANPDWRLTIEGHADAQGTPEVNQALSERRAQAIKAHLESAGIAPARLTALGFGASRPALPDVRHGSLDRRVELHRR